MYLICLFLFLIISLFLIIYRCYKKQYFNNIDHRDIYGLYTDYKEYRLGDAFYDTSLHRRWHIRKGKNLTFEYYLKKFPTSILSNYLVMSNYKSEDYKSMLSIINKKYKQDYTINKNKDCLMHIRLGDAIDSERWCKSKRSSFYKIFYTSNTTNSSCKYLIPKKIYEEKIKKAIKMGINKIYIIAGSHKKLKSYKYSNTYLSEIIKLIKDNNLKLELKLGQHPDDDLLFSNNFNYFIPSSGQYCKLIMDINKKNNKNFKII